MVVPGIEQIVYAAGGATVTFLIQQFWKRTIGTAYRTQQQCDDCSVRASMDVIRSLVVELAIKAGVPAHEVAKIVGRIGGGVCEGSRGRDEG
jgi:hypothetical protein